MTQVPNREIILKVKTGVVGILCVAWACHAQGVAPTGTLRAVFLQSNPVQGRIDAKTGAVSGPAAELTRELGKQLGIPVTIAGLPNAKGTADESDQAGAIAEEVDRCPAHVAEGGEAPVAEENQSALHTEQKVENHSPHDSSLTE